MYLRIGDIAPNFKAETTLGPIDFYAFKGKSWCVLFSHPKDFTPVCTTELGEVARLMPQFAERDCKVIGLSADPVQTHLIWDMDIEQVTGSRVTFPMIGDEQLEVANLYGMVAPNVNDTQTVRSVFFISPDNRVRMILTYPMQVGRNFQEVLRALDALQLAARFPVSTPANWQSGGKVIVSLALTTGEAREMFGEVDEVKPYLRFTPQPVTVVR